MVAHDQPARLVRLRPAARPRTRARCSPTSSSPSSTRPRSSACTGKEGFLISEAVRGEGATLHDHDGERFVNELDPRDAVARAIFSLLERTGATSVGLDMTMVDPGRFPNVVAALQEAGLDPTTQRVPVAPASHYVMGGIVTDLDGRATGVERLYAVGECACTGLHGANRLASNSLSECFVFGRRAALEGARRAAARRARAPTPATRSRRRRRETRKAVWASPAWSATRADLDDARERPVPARPPRRRLGARPPRDARLARPRRVPGARPRARRATTRSSTPAPTTPRFETLALLIDWGGVLTTSMLDSFDAFGAPRGPRRPHARSATTRGARRADRARDRPIDIADVRGPPRPRARRRRRTTSPSA